MTWLLALDWKVVAIAAFAVIVTQFFVPRFSNRGIAAMVRLGVAVVAVLAVGGLIDGVRSGMDRRALQARASEIAARTLIPGSPLACLDGLAGETVESTCEKAVFARPETAAAAVAYTEARLTLLADSLKLVGDDRTFDTLIAGLRRSIELDRFGLAAQVLATRDGCTAEKCPAFALVQESTTLRANLKGRAYDTYVARYAADWTKEDAAPAVADGTPKDTKPDDRGQNRPTALSSRYDFPSAASIPPVSIMNAEPARAQAEPGAASDAEAPLPPRRPATQDVTTR